MNLIADVGFDQSFSFIYSRRPGTPAASLPDDVPHEEKQQRLAALQARVNEQAQAISRAHGRHGAARAGRASVEEGRAAAGGPHREHALGELRRPAGVDQPASPTS